MADYTIDRIKFGDNTYRLTDTESGYSTNWVDGSTSGSVRTSGSKPESASYSMGYFALAEGNNTTASGYYSHAEGKDTTASSSGSHAEGNNTIASSNYSHAEGFYTTASGYYSHAEGNNTTASGYYSHAGGVQTYAQTKSQTAIGEYNILDTGGSTTTRGDYAFIIGNGDSTARSNALTVDWSGNLDVAGLVTDSSGNTLINDVTLNGSSIVSSGVADITDASGNLTLNGSLTTGTNLDIGSYIDVGDHIYLPNNKRLYGKRSDGTTNHVLIGIDSSNLIHIGTSATASNVNFGFYASNATLSTAGHLTLSNGIRVEGHSSDIGDIILGTINSTTSVGTSGATLGTIDLPAGNWIITGYVQFPGNSSAGYRRAFITDSDGGTATGAYGASAGYAPASTIVTQQVTFITPTLTSSSTRYLLRASASVTLTISYRNFKAIRIV